jgi:rubrerythrin
MEFAMYHKFNAKEILEMAEKIEQNGYQFYRQAADDIGDETIRKFLLELADMEVGHEKVFQDMKKQLSDDEKADVVFDPFEETAAYIQALADTRVFYEKEIDTTSVEAVLRAGIAAEKESIVFYLGMKDMVPAGQGRDKIESIINEEMQHIRVINNQLIKYRQQQ